jgi:hypothetical protein
MRVRGGGCMVCGGGEGALMGDDEGGEMRASW